MGRTDFLKHQNGTRIVRLIGNWETEMASVLTDRRKEYDQISISHGDWPTLSFLAEFVPNLERLSLGGTVSSFRDIEGLPKLKYLWLGHASKPQLNFSHLPALRELVVDHFHKSYKELFFLPSLNHLTLSKYTGKILQDFSTLKELSFLDLRQGSVTMLTGLGSLEKLQRVELTYLRNLSDIRELELIKSLTYLVIAKCPKLTPNEILEQIPNAVRERRPCFHNENADFAAIPKRFGGAL
jgi:hypothetical protein